MARWNSPAVSKAPESVAGIILPVCFQIQHGQSGMDFLKGYKTTTCLGLQREPRKQLYLVLPDIHCFTVLLCFYEGRVNLSTKHQRNPLRKDREV